MELRITLLLRLVLAAAMLAGVVPSLEAKILDPERLDLAVGSHVLLNEIAPLVEDKGFDVVLGGAKSVPYDSRVRLAHLDGFSASPDRNWASYPPDHWTYGFEKGMVEAILGVKTEAERFLEACVDAGAGSVPAEFACRFVEEWVAAPAERRVFVAFTQSDRHLADAVRSALGRLGYVTFTYLRDEAEGTWASSVLVGTAFSQAGNRFVIDSLASRGSEGVAFEGCAWALSPAIRANDQWTNRIKEASE